MTRVASLTLVDHLTAHREISLRRSWALFTGTELALYPKHNSRTLAEQERMASYQHSEFLLFDYPRFKNATNDLWCPERSEQTTARSSSTRERKAAKSPLGAVMIQPALRGAVFFRPAEGPCRGPFLHATFRQQWCALRLCATECSWGAGLDPECCHVSKEVLLR